MGVAGNKKKAAGGYILFVAGYISQMFLVTVTILTVLWCDYIKKL